MATIQIRCPHCAAALKMAADSASGKQIRCPKCQEMFRPGANPPRAAAPVPPRTGVKRAPSDDWDEDEAPDRRKSSIKSGGPKATPPRRTVDEEDEDERPRRRS